jgi:serine/threonine protein kinase
MLPVPTNISHDFHTNKTQTIQDGYIIKVVRGHSLSQFIGNFEEIILSSGHDHPNILLCKGFNFMNVKPDEWYTYIFYPRMKLSLADDLNARAREKQYYTTQELVTYMSTLLSVLEYLDKKDLAHTNIKPENVFFGNDGELLVSEIGSRSFHSSVLKEGASATVYTAPEAVKIQKGDVKTLIQGDIWSLGTLFMEMLTLKKVT